MMNCANFELLMADALGDELSPGDRIVFEAHLGECQKCRQEYATARRAVAVMRELPGPVKLVRDSNLATAGKGDRLVLEDKRAAGSTARGAPRWLKPPARKSASLFRYAASLLIAFAAGYALNERPNPLPVGPKPSRDSQKTTSDTLRGALVSVHVRNPARCDLAKCLIAFAHTEPSAGLHRRLTIPD